MNKAKVLVLGGLRDEALTDLKNLIFHQDFLKSILL